MISILKSILLMIVIVVSVRELSLIFMNYFGHPELSNLVGLFLLLISLVIYRRFKGIPSSLITANQLIMKESVFAFLPVCVGSLIMLFHLEDSLYLFLSILVISTLLPLLLFAFVVKRVL
ncbi:MULTISPECIES: hypothetical protein [Acinetobacter]|jgi:hypothetical protein|uniref:CidA/LrgA family protein n=1 Tax=Acinetobacter pittii TaxID=48296 RepID=A0A242UCS2_ACIPI|nr:MULTISPECIES: hypothetical protein [Acinetobacter]MDN4022526.1 hypothetical protein [Acinetobacter pittii]OTU31317.1 hypothetical protein CAT59_00025 [Acinetobacter pittii]